MQMPMRRTETTSLRETEYKISDNTLSISPEKETAYTVEIFLENVGSGDSSIVVTPYTSTALSRESAIIYSDDLTLLLDDKYNFSNYALIESEALDDDDQIEILPNESVLVTVTITLPEEPAREGTVMGQSILVRSWVLKQQKIQLVSNLCMSHLFLSTYFLVM